MLHVHLLILGMFFFLIFALFISKYPNILENKKTKIFYVLYNVSLGMFFITLLARGIVQVLNISLSTSGNAMLSGIAGVSHILLSISFVLFFLILKAVIKK